MAVDNHLKVKPSILAEAAVTGLADKLAISHTVTHGADYSAFDGSKDQTITKRVKGSLPIREYAVGNDRSEPIVTDEYREQTVQVTVSRKRPYSAVRLTDEQKDWEFEDGWAELLDAQTDAMSGYLENGVFNQIVSAPFEVVRVAEPTTTNIEAARKRGESYWHNFFVELQLAMRKMRNPDAQLTAQVGYTIAEQLMTHAVLDKDTGTGASALTDATLGKLANITFMLNPNLPHDAGVIYAKSAVVVHSSTATVPNSVPFGSTANANGWAVRWMMDYETGYLSDRSVIDCFSGYQYTTDNLILMDQQGIEHVGTESFFVRGALFGIKGGTVGATNKSPGDGSSSTPGGNVDSWLAKAYTGQRIETTIGEGTAWPLAGNPFGAVVGGAAEVGE